MPLSAAVNGSFVDEFSVAFVVVSLDLNRDVVTSEIWTVRSGTNFRFIGPAPLFVAGSSSGALSADFTTFVIPEFDELFFGGFRDERRLKKKREENSIDSLVFLLDYRRRKITRTIVMITSKRRAPPPPIIPMRISERKENKEKAQRSQSITNNSILKNLFETNVSSLFRSNVLFHYFSMQKYLTKSGRSMWKWPLQFVLHH